MLPAISLKDAESSAISRGPSSLARAVRSPRASLAADSRTRSSGRTTRSARKRPATTATAADAAETARILTSSPMWNITQPDSSTEASGRPTASAARAASWTRTRRQRPQGVGEHQADGERGGGDVDGVDDHGTSL